MRVVRFLAEGLLTGVLIVAFTAVLLMAGTLFWRFFDQSYFPSDFVFGWTVGFSICPAVIAAERIVRGAAA